ncbi:TM1812 family CRISPR-associated protein [Hydrogenimonas thermophila]|uniref:CRISPR-associated DxTHG motif protein n=1 Tax=Hydrogenimonas thermophila TaxID=223786 RepID=UPI002936F5FE|nr:TM1812 family CRISPR-associated protein [Hydrogenimonas thermophila]WOE70982.1 TM1812 family CRISPR-associated protein [Hydrogenimonas thermophila]WOE73500.1 TM1812 family CRISPR-associated protein [Hydrogenimonas thermophila]
MKKAVITILGTIGIQNKKATYISKIPKVKADPDINTFPILIKNFSKEYEIVALHTDYAKNIQTEVIENDSKIKNFEFKDEWKIEDDTEFDEIFSKIDDLISSYDKVIIDVSHGFRHLPILLMVDVIIHNVRNIDKIEMILFAKEIKKQEEYEFIDLKRYLDLANIAYALTTFERNYTVANNVRVSDPELDDFLKDLSNFSKHILANSLDELLKDTNKQRSITTLLIQKIETLLLKREKDIFNNLKRLLKNTKEHLEEIKSYTNLNRYQTLFFIAQNMYNKGYLLNSITLLSEAIGIYCTLALKSLDNSIKEKIDEYEKNAISQKNNEKVVFKLYDLYNQSKALYNVKNYEGIFMKVKYQYNNKNRAKYKKWNDNAKNITEKIRQKIDKNEHITELILTIDDVRNNLAHANSSKRLKDVDGEIKKALNDFENLCIKRDVLNIK